MRLISLFLSLFLMQGLLTAQRLTDTITPTARGIHHVRLSVQDLERSVAFYTDAFAMQTVSRSRKKVQIPKDNPEKKGKILANSALMRSPNAYFELVEYEGAKNEPPCTMPIQGAGITHVCYQMPMSKPIYEKVKMLGAKMVSRGDKPVDLGGYGIYYAYTRDPDNILFEMEHFDKPPFTDSVWIGHVALVTPNIDTLVAFYTRLLGIRPHRRSDNIPLNTRLDAIGNVDSIKLRGAWFRVGNMILEMWQYENPPTPMPKSLRPFTQIGYQTIAFEVGNIQQDYIRLTGRNVKFASKPRTQNGVKIVFLRDPDGNLISLQESKKGSVGAFDNLKMN